MTDLSILINEWGIAVDHTPADLNDDGVVNGIDLAILLSDWDRNP